MIGKEGEKMKKIYLAGAIEVYGRKGNYDEANQWRKKVKNYFSNYLLDFECVNPMDYYLYDSNYHKSEFEVMRFDLRLVKQADIVLVNLDYIRDSVGTSDEIFYAYMLGKPVIGFIEGRITELDVASIMNMIHPWKYYQIDRIETGPGALDKAMEYIKDFYGD